MEPKIFTIEYSGKPFERWANLGDDIQSLAAKRLLPRISGSLLKGDLDRSAETGVISMNGFFPGEAGWPPAAGLVPFFHSFHISPKAEQKICSKEGLAYLSRFAPIGCRDRGTLKILQSHGIQAYYSKCISLTFPKREVVPEHGKVFLVSLSRGAMSALPRALRKRAVTVEQAKLRLPGLSGPQRESLAQHLLDVYAREAALVITSKIHCAMPCIAMGIPVVFLYDRAKKNDPRVAVVADLIDIHYIGETAFFRNVVNPVLGLFFNWSPRPVDIEQEKRVIQASYLAAFNQAMLRKLGTTQE